MCIICRLQHRYSKLTSVRVVGLPANLVELLVKVVELGNARHDVLVHEVRRLQHLVLALPEEGDSVVDEGLVEHDAGVLQEVATVPGDRHSLDRKSVV